MARCRSTGCCTHRNSAGVSQQAEVAAHVAKQQQDEGDFGEHLQAADWEAMQRLV